MNIFSHDFFRNFTTDFLLKVDCTLYDDNYGEPESIHCRNDDACETTVVVEQ